MASSKFPLLSRVLLPILVFQLTAFSYYVYMHTNLQKKIPMDFSSEIIKLADFGTTTAGDNYYNTQPPTLKLSSIPWLSAPWLPRVLTRKQYNKVIDLLRTFTGLLDKANITYVMCDGTLLGSYMNHDIIPWDDDLDLMVRYRDLPKVKQIFKQESIWREYSIHGYHDPSREYDFDTLQKLPKDINDPQYYFVNATGFKLKKADTLKPRKKKLSKLTLYHKFKFFKKNSTKAGKYNWNWPFVDIKYYMENDTHIWNLDFRRRVLYHKRSDFYPLHRRPFGSLLLPAPHDTHSFLKKKFRTFVCKKGHWNHITENRVKEKLVPCSKLSRYYPFVWRERSDKGVLETLKVDNKVIHSIELPEIFRPSKPFAL